MLTDGALNERLPVCEIRGTHEKVALQVGVQAVGDFLILLVTRLGAQQFTCRETQIGDHNTTKYMRGVTEQ